MQNAAELYAQNSATKDDLSIETASGAVFHINDPKFDINDIAHALAHQCRYTGHTRYFYSVAEHSVLVAKLVSDLHLGDPFEGLMHDAAEAYLSDIAAPWKVLLPDYKVLEKRIETPLRNHFGLPVTMSDGVKQADWMALFIEAYTLIPSKAAAWVSPPGLKEQAIQLAHHEDYQIFCYAPGSAKQIFLRAFNDFR